MNAEEDAIDQIKKKKKTKQQHAKIIKTPMRKMLEVESIVQIRLY